MSIGGSRAMLGSAERVRLVGSDGPVLGRSFLAPTLTALARGRRAQTYRFVLGISSASTVS